MKKIMMFVFLMLMPFLALAQEVADMDLGSLVNQAVADFGSLNGLSGQALVMAGAAYLIRILISTLKVSILREKIWDKLGAVPKLLVAPVLGILLSVVSLPDLGMKTVLASIVAGGLGIAIHHLLKVIEGLPGISASVQALIGLVAKLLGGPQAK